MKNKLLLAKPFQMTAILPKRFCPAYPALEREIAPSCSSALLKGLHEHPVTSDL